MEFEIHARETKQGLRFRIWSARYGHYASKTLREKEIGDALLALRLERTRKEHYMLITLELATACINGSSNKQSKRELDSLWNESKHR